MSTASCPVPPREGSSIASAGSRAALLACALLPPLASCAPRPSVLASEAHLLETGIVGAAGVAWSERRVDLAPLAGREAEIRIRVEGRADMVALGEPKIIAPRAAPDNLLVYVVDCLRADRVGAMGYARPTTRRSIASPPAPSSSSARTPAPHGPSPRSAACSPGCTRSGTARAGFEGLVRAGRSGLERDSDLYDSELAYTDRELGRLLDGVRRLQPDQRTTILVTADHGEEFGEHASARHGHTLFDTLLDVPMILKLAGRTDGRRIEDSVAQVDVMPTLLELARAPAPTGARRRLSRARGPGTLAFSPCSLRGAALAARGALRRAARQAQAGPPAPSHPGRMAVRPRPGCRRDAQSGGQRAWAGLPTGLVASPLPAPGTGGDAYRHQGPCATPCASA